MYNTNSLHAQHSISRKLSQKETHAKCYSLSQYLKHWSGDKVVSPFISSQEETALQWKQF